MVIVHRLTVEERISFGEMQMQCKFDLLKSGDGRRKSGRRGMGVA